MATAKKISAKQAIKIPVKTSVSPARKVIAKTASQPAIKLTTASKPNAKKLPVNKVDAKASSKQVVIEPIVKQLKPKKIKLVRDSFTIPKPEYLVLDNLKLRAADLKHPVKKGELLRAGIKALAAMNDANLLIALKAVPLLKTGRPSK
jgi:hypothetical protein